jgi:hypothetical protein
MRSVRYVTRTLALTLSLAVAAWLLPSSPARAGQGHGGGHAGLGGPGPSGHHGHQHYLGGYGATWGGYGGTWSSYYPYWGYDAPYEGYYGYGIFDRNNPYLGVINPYWSTLPSNTYRNYNFVNSTDLFQ